MEFFWIPKMAVRNIMPIFVFLIIYINHVAGVDVPGPDKLAVNILDGEVIVYWEHPVDAPPNSRYNVEMGDYRGAWTTVDTCTGITRTFCDLSSRIHNHRNKYKVRVHLVAGENKSEWAAKTFLPNASELQPPTFTLWATSSTLTVYIHEKHILKKLFPYGVTYTIYLEERGENNKTIIALLRDDGEEKTFSSLRWGREYCVSVMVEGNGALSTSSVSPKKCQLLPEQEWFVIAVSSLSILGVLMIIIIVATILLCYLKHPEKTPAALKSPVSSWLPLSVGEASMEVVTDKGWFLSSNRTEVKNCVNDPVTHVTVTDDNEEEDRRTSTDSGVSMRSASAANNGGGPLMRQEDSGCGSMGGPENTTSGQTVYPLEDDTKTADANTDRKRQDSGLGMGCRLHSSSITLDCSGHLKESVAGGSYRSQSSSVVQIDACDQEDMFKQIRPDPGLAEVVTGYRAGPQSCICSGAGQCSWCHKQGHYGPDVIRKYRAVCIENGLLGSQCDLVDSYKGEVTFAGYAKKTQTDTVIMEDLETTFLQLGETFPLLTSLSSPPLAKCGQDFNMNNVSLSLCDVQLEND